MERALIKPEDVRYLKNALASIGTKNETIPITDITKDDNTGEIRVISIDGKEPLSPTETLKKLSKTTIYPKVEDKTQQIEVFKNIKTVAGLGAFALGQLTEEGKHFSETRLKTIQKTIDAINVEMYGANLRRNQNIPGFVEAIAYINSVVYRTWAKRQFAEKFEKEE